MTDTALELKKLLQDIFDDEIVEPGEREALARFTKEMSWAEASAVFRSFVAEKWGEAMADDVLTASEVRLMGHIMTELHLDIEDLPIQARLALKDAI